MKEYFPKTISKKQASDSGMAFVLILLLIGAFTKNDVFFKIAIPALIMNMIFPMFFFLFAIVWLGFSNIIGEIVSKIILTIVFILLVVPVGFIRKMLKKDPLQLTKFKKSEKTVMIKRNFVFSSKDIEKPY